MLDETSIFNQTLANLDLLDEHTLPDDQPHIECYKSLFPLTATSLESDFKDICLYANITNKYCEESAYFNGFMKVINEGKNYFVMLYTWRCCSRAIPQPKSNEQPNRVEIYEKTVEVLGPEVQKLLKFMYYCKKATETFVNEIKRICFGDKKRPFLNETYLLMMARLLEVFLNLDELKNMKSSIKNDYSAYRRAAQFLKVMHNSSEALQESQNLSMFLANQNKIRFTLKAQLLEQCDFFEEILYEIARSCANAFERGAFTTPAEKHMLIKVIAFTVNLMDSDRFNIYNPKQTGYYSSTGGILTNNKNILNSLDLSIGGNKNVGSAKRLGSSTLNSLSLMNTQTGTLNAGKKPSTNLSPFGVGGGISPSSASQAQHYNTLNPIFYTAGLNNSNHKLNFTRLDRIIGTGPKFLPIYIAGKSTDELNDIYLKSSATEKTEFEFESDSAVTKASEVISNSKPFDTNCNDRAGLIDYPRFATDMQINVFASYIVTGTNYDATKWPVCNTASTTTTLKSNTDINFKSENNADRSGRSRDLPDTAVTGQEAEILSRDESIEITTTSAKRRRPILHPLLAHIHSTTAQATIPASSDTNLSSNPAPSTSFKRTFNSISIPALSLALNPFYGISFASSPNSSTNPANQSSLYRQYCKPLLVELTLARQMFTAYSFTLALHINEASLCQTQRILTDAQNKEMKDLALRGLLLLAHWNCVLSETHSTKLMNPTDSSHCINCPPNAEDYERAIKYNYTGEEKIALIEMIALIKSLQSLLIKANPLFRESILRSVYAELQDLVQLVIREPLRKAIKNKKELIKSILLATREVCIDLHGAYNANQDPMFRGKKDASGDSSHSQPFEVQVPRKAVSPSYTQIYIIRALLEMLVSDHYPPGAKKPCKKELETTFITTIETFLRTSYYWPHLLNYSAVMSECGDLSYFWYREFYLEMTMGARIQFPIDMSTPWILCSTILRSKKPSLIESLLYILDLYNESAQFALLHLRKRYLYDEIEAEVNLCFDQLVYLLSEQIFAYYKQLAACTLMDTRFHQEWAAFGNRINFPTSHRYHILLQQRHIQLLGRWVDLNRLLNQRIYLAIKKSLETAIDYFETTDITSIVEFDALIEVNRYTYKLLSKYLQIPVSFELMLHAIINSRVSDDKNIGLKSLSNLNSNTNIINDDRIIRHVIRELLNDFCPNYCYNATTNRFVKTKEINFSPSDFNRAKLPILNSQAYLWGSKALNTAYSAMYIPYKSFIGPVHLRTLCKLLGYRGLSLVINALLDRIQDLINGDLLKHVRTLMKFMPKQSKLLRYEYGSPGILAYYQAQLKDIIRYSDLKTGTFQLFRETGNCIIFMLCLEKNLFEEETMDLLQAAIFQNVIPRPFCADGEKLEQKLKVLEAKCNALNIVNFVEKFGSAKQTYIARESDLLTKERLCCGLSIFQTVLVRICKMFLHQQQNSAEPDNNIDASSSDAQNINIWTGQPLKSSSVSDINNNSDSPAPTTPIMSFDTCTEFHRLWSALQFVWCTPTGPNEFTIEQLYGESINWAGCAFIYLLNQQNRFETLDFSYHLLKVQRVDNCDMDKQSGINLKRMADRIRKFQVLNGQIFALFARYLNQSALRSVYTVVESEIYPENKNGNNSNDNELDASYDNDEDPKNGIGDNPDDLLPSDTTYPSSQRESIEHIRYFEPPVHELTLRLT